MTKTLSDCGNWVTIMASPGHKITNSHMQVFTLGGIYPAERAHEYFEVDMEKNPVVPEPEVKANKLSTMDLERLDLIMGTIHRLVAEAEKIKQGL